MELLKIIPKEILSVIVVKAIEKFSPPEWGSLQVTNKVFHELTTQALQILNDMKVITSQGHHGDRRIHLTIPDLDWDKAETGKYHICDYKDKTLVLIFNSDMEFVVDDDHAEIENIEKEFIGSIIIRKKQGQHILKFVSEPNAFFRKRRSRLTVFKVPIPNLLYKYIFWHIERMLLYK